MCVVRGSSGGAGSRLRLIHERPAGARTLRRGAGGVISQGGQTPLADIDTASIRAVLAGAEVCLARFAFDLCDALDEVRAELDLRPRTVVHDCCMNARKAEARITGALRIMPRHMGQGNWMVNVKDLRRALSGDTQVNPECDCPACGRPVTVLRWDVNAWHAHHAPAEIKCELTRAQARQLLEQVGD